MQTDVERRYVVSVTSVVKSAEELVDFLPSRRGFPYHRLIEGNNLDFFEAGRGYGAQDVPVKVFRFEAVREADR